MDFKLVSVVIPVYNAEKYLDKCIESIVGQSFANLEIIIVDDESIDNSPLICERWKLKDNRIRVIRKKNEGAGYARNTGIEAASGDFLFFIDSDDYLNKDAIQKCYKCAIETGAEIVTFGITMVAFNEMVINESIPKSSIGLYRGKEVQNIFLADKIANGKETDVATNLQCGACMANFYDNKLIKKVGWRFASEREVYSEDFYSQLVLFNYVNAVFVLGEPLYYYRIHSNSLSHSNRVCDYNKVKVFYNKCIEVKEKMGYCDIVGRRLIEPYISYTIVALKRIVREKKFFEGYGLFKIIISDSVLEKALQEKDTSRDGMMRKVLYYFMRKKMTHICYVIIKLREYI